MEENLEVQAGVVIPGSELSWTASRSGGPGGQHVNKTSTKVTLKWNLLETNALSEEQKTRAIASLGSRVNKEGVLKLDVDDTRSQKQNRETARSRLAELLRDAISVKKPREPTAVPGASKMRRLKEKARRGDLKRLRKTPTDDEA